MQLNPANSSFCFIFFLVFVSQNYLLVTEDECKSDARTSLFLFSVMLLGFVVNMIYRQLHYPKKGAAV